MNRKLVIASGGGEGRGGKEGGGGVSGQPYPRQ